MNILEYKGYYTKIEYNVEDRVLYGKIEGIRDLVNFESDNAADIENEFHAAVDDYLEFCKEVGKEPDKEYKGSFNIRINPELHRSLVGISFKNGRTLNATIEKALEEYVSRYYSLPSWEDAKSPILNYSDAASYKTSPENAEKHIIAFKMDDQRLQQ
ncbi:MAG TPA: toxin-antitoxin system HicB family antitoxin [Lachnospiraceae bacterium]|jgi:predicted HicB family RNase H-like nuclease|nr:toxin-antitoxin system HicB family antitoxin [Lachnospiraceae bacterium]